MVWSGGRNGKEGEGKNEGRERIQCWCDVVRVGKNEEPRNKG